MAGAIQWSASLARRCHFASSDAWLWKDFAVVYESLLEE